MVVNMKYKYFKYLNSTLCRFIYNEPKNSLSSVGEIFLTIKVTNDINQ